MRRSPSATTRTTTLAAALAVAACGGGGSSSAPIQYEGPPELLACRARVDDAHRFAEIALRTMQNLGKARVADRTGPELRARLHPDGRRVVFARERSFQDPDSRELFVATIDGSAAEQRLTQNVARDDEPVWSPDGSRILFSSERNGGAELWIVDGNGSGAELFLPPPAGHADGEPDWHRASNRIVWSRRGTDQRHTLWVAGGSGVGSTPLTDGGATTGAGTGDRDPAWAPDGGSVVFVRRFADDRASLCRVDVGTGTVTTLLQPTGDVALPRVAPAMDRVYFGLAEPTLGRATLRLAELPMAGGTPVLAWPDERWRLHGIDFVPTAPPRRLAGTPVPLDVERADLQIAAARSASGVRAHLARDDGQEYYLETATSGGREVAGVNVRFDLPVAEPEDVLELHVRAIARASRIDGDSVLRMSIYNPADTRFDTAVEWRPTSTGEQTMSFRTSSLRHVTRERQLRVTVIADLAPGDPADLWIDLVEVTLVPRAAN